MRPNLIFIIYCCINYLLLYLFITVYYFLLRFITFYLSTFSCPVAGVDGGCGGLCLGGKVGLQGSVLPSGPVLHCRCVVGLSSVPRCLPLAVHTKHMSPLRGRAILPL